MTGAASGIGRATAIRLSSEGADLALADINHEALEQLASELTANGNPPPTVLPFDAGDAESCRQLVDRAYDVRERLDVLCNIAGIMAAEHFTRIHENDWERMLRINLTSVFHLTKRAMPHLIKSRGNVVNIASAAGLTGIAYTASYSAAKAGVIALTKSNAVEFAADGVRVNAVCPGGVDTPMHQQGDAPEGADLSLFERHWPKLGGLCEPADIASAVAYLGSDDARQVTGITLVVDGGQLAG